MNIVLTVTGVAVIAVGLHDMYHALLHPTGKGHLSRWILAAIWRMSKLHRHRLARGFHG